MDRERMTQQQEILRYIQEHGSITRLEAACDLHIFELSSRIGELKAKGHKIEGSWAKAINKYGRISRFKKYTIKGEQI